MLRAALLVLVVALALPAAAAAAPIKAGVGKADTTWRVGPSSGQYASGCPEDLADNRCSFIGDHGFDPGMHGTRRTASYGVQSRLETRAIVIENTEGKRFAIVKNDLYIPQDLLYRRVALLLEASGSKVTRETLTVASTHNHSSPYYSTPSWGVWTFQDVGDMRFFEFYARQMAKAVQEAEGSLKPVRVGASVSQLPDLHRNVPGPATADDGTPAGFPQDFNDHDVAVVRFDDISGEHPKPLAVLATYSLHPEMLDQNDLISGDYIAPFQRMVDRATGATTIFVQQAVGSSEPDRDRNMNADIHKRLELYHRQYAQSEWGARWLADTVLENWRRVDGGPEPKGTTDRDRARFVPFRSDFAADEVAMVDRWYPGPFSHPYPGVANCRTDTTLSGDVRVPVANSCEGPGTAFTPLTTDDFQALGIPVPENYTLPAYTGLEEDISLHFQALRLGDILMTVCPCEQQADQSLNIKTRTDRVAGNEFLGYEPPECNAAAELCERMYAQIRNPANGWNLAQNAPYAESEDPDPAKIKGNFTHDDDERSANLGYKLTLALSMANDYNGYIVSYREYQRGDHYRKSLAGWGAHSMDYMATRLVTLGRLLQDPGLELPEDQQQEQNLDAKTQADLAKNDAEARSLGEAGGARLAAEEAALPDDAGPVVAVREPESIQRFATAFFTWNGGSNTTDDPVVRVERRVGGEWKPYADQSGEVPVTLEFPQVDQVGDYLTGSHRWEWTAHFEAFASNFDTGAPSRATPAGTYRFVVDGLIRRGGKPQPYRLESRTFEVRPWSGITADDARVEPNRTVSFRVGPRTAIPVSDGVTAEIGPIDYPDSYESPIRYIENERWFVRDPQAPNDPSRFEWYCLTCTFRPWADAGDAHAATVIVYKRGGSFRKVTATRRGDRWATTYALRRGERAYVGAGCVTDAFGNVNGARSALVGDATAGAPPAADCVPAAAPAPTAAATEAPPADESVDELPVELPLHGANE